VRDYLNLFILNDGPGVAKEIRWEIEKVEKDGKVTQETNSQPYIGKGAKVNVKGYLDARMLVNEENEFSYKITTTFRPVLGFRRKSTHQKFNAS